MSERTFTQLFDEARGMPEYWEEGAVLDFTEALHDAMEEQGTTRTELARRLGTSQAYITRVLSGRANFTLKTMARLALALGLQLEVGLAPQRLPSAAGKPGAEEQGVR
jgi:transcriptional regulator with XRE-family HTH domain